MSYNSFPQVDLEKQFVAKHGFPLCFAEDAAKQICSAKLVLMLFMFRP